MRWLCLALFALHNDTLYLFPPFFLLFCRGSSRFTPYLMILFINYCSARYNSFVFSILLPCLHSNLRTRTLRTRIVSPPHIGLMLCPSIFLSLFRTKKQYSFPQLHSFMQTQDSALSKLLLKFSLDSAENQPLLNRLGVTCVKVAHKYPTNAHAC